MAWIFSQRQRQGCDRCHPVAIVYAVVVNAALTLLVVMAAVIKPEWSTMKEMVVYWVR